MREGHITKTRQSRDRVSGPHPRLGARPSVAAGVSAILLMLAVVVPWHTPAHAQTGRIEVFLAQDPETNAARLYFMDALSGLSTVVNVENGRFALLGDYVLYEKSRTGAIMRVHPDGTLEPHPFMRRAVDTVALDWIVSPDGQSVAWTVVNTAGESAAFIAWADGSDLRQLPLLPEREQRALFPLALVSERTLFFYDSAHVLPSENPAPYALYHHVMEYSISSEMILPLAGEPACPCAAAITPDGRIMVRLQAEAGQGPFALHVRDLITGADIQIPAPQIALRQAGDLVINANGTRAVYNAAAGVGVEAGLVPEQYALVLADVGAGTQRILIPSGEIRYRPLGFIDGDAALMLTDARAGGTFKFDLERDRLEQVSDKRYLGALTR